jgi:hypothetical protein
MDTYFIMLLGEEVRFCIINELLKFSKQYITMRSAEFYILHLEIYKPDI